MSNCKADGCALEADDPERSDYCPQHRMAGLSRASDIDWSRGDGSGGSPTNWGNIFHFRFWLSVILLPAIVATLAQYLADWLFWPVFVVLAVVMFVGALKAPPLKCPLCGKRIKANYSVCHHCGHDTSVQAATR